MNDGAGFTDDFGREKEYNEPDGFVEPEKIDKAFKHFGELGGYSHPQGMVGFVNSKIEGYEDLNTVSTFAALLLSLPSKKRPPVQDVAADLGVRRSTVYNALHNKRVQEFAAKLIGVQSLVHWGDIMDSMLQAAKSGDVKAAKFFMEQTEKLERERYGREDAPSQVNVYNLNMGDAKLQEAFRHAERVVGMGESQGNVSNRRYVRLNKPQNEEEE